MEISERRCEFPSFRLDVGRPDDLGPLFCFGCHERTELSRAEKQWQGVRLRNARAAFGIRQASIDFGIEPFDDLWRNAPSDSKPVPATDFKSRNCVSHPRHIR